MTKKMKKGVSVKEHVLDMINIMHDVTIHGEIINERTQVSIILESLSPAFKGFTTNYVMNKLSYNMTQLLNELQTYESLNKGSEKEGEANVADSNPSYSKAKTKKRKNGNGKNKEKDKNSKKPKKSSKSKENKNTKSFKKKTPKGTSFHCGVDGHQKRNCPKYLADLKEKKKGKFDLLVLEACLVEDNSSSWIVDSGATKHVCFSLQILSSTRKLADGEVTMRVGSGQIVSPAAVGTTRLEFEKNKFLVLENVYYIPGFSRNLISVSMLHE